MRQKPRRVWLVISDEDGNPEQGFEIPDARQVDVTTITDEPDGAPWSFAIPERGPVSTATITIVGSTLVMYRPQPDGQWSEDDQPADAPARLEPHPLIQRALPPGGARGPGAAG